MCNVFLVCSDFCFPQNLVLSKVKWSTTGYVFVRIRRLLWIWPLLVLLFNLPIAVSRPEHWSAFAKYKAHVGVSPFLGKLQDCNRHMEGLLQLDRGKGRVLTGETEALTKYSQKNINMFMLIVRISHKIFYGKIPAFAKIGCLLKFNNCTFLSWTPLFQKWFQWNICRLETQQGTKSWHIDASCMFSPSLQLLR